MEKLQDGFIATRAQGLLDFLPSEIAADLNEAIVARDWSTTKMPSLKKKIGKTLEKAVQAQLSANKNANRRTSSPPHRDTKNGDHGGRRWRCRADAVLVVTDSEDDEGSTGRFDRWTGGFANADHEDGKVARDGLIEEDAQKQGEPREMEEHSLGVGSVEYFRLLG